jgi:NAD(P)-dependent dehydrogenase (short-subunit alcohol dehydrogenase family)
MNKDDALIYAKDNIKSNSLHSGFIKTPLVEILANEVSIGPKEFKKLLDNCYPVVPIGTPDDVAYGLLYWASGEIKFVTGNELVIDGGYTCQ